MHDLKRDTRYHFRGFGRGLLFKACSLGVYLFGPLDPKITTVPLRIPRAISHPLLALFAWFYVVLVTAPLGICIYSDQIYIFVVGILLVDRPPIAIA